MTAAAKATKVVNILMNVGSKLSDLLANTSTADVPGRDIRLIDQLIATSIQSIKIAKTLGFGEDRICVEAEKNSAIACGHLGDLCRWLDLHPGYVSQTSDGRKRAGKPVDGKVIRDGLTEVLERLRKMIPPSTQIPMSSALRLTR